MFDFNANAGAHSTTSTASLESHMSQLSRTMIQLAQANQTMAKQPTTAPPSLGIRTATAGRCIQCISKRNGAEKV